MNKKVIIIGNGGHAAVLTEILLQQQYNIIGYTAPKEQENRFSISYLGTDEIIDIYSPNEIELVLGLGSVTVSDARKNLFESFKQKGFSFATVIHQQAVVSPFAFFGEGVQIMAGSVIQPFTQIADNTIINTSASIDHDCTIGKHCHIAPGVTCSGGVTIGEATHIGTGTTVIQNVNVGNRVLIGAGSVVLKDIPDNCKVYGVPAKEV